MAKKQNKRGAKLLRLLALFGVSIACGFLGGILLARQLPDNLPDWFFLLLMAGLIVGVYLHIILHEAGHLVFGLLTGYRFSSFRIGGLILLRQNGRLCVKRFHLPGTGGQCLMLPPPGPAGECPYLWYNLGGAIMNLAVSGVFLCLSPAVPNALIKTLLTLAGVMGIILALLNGLPHRLGGMPNDGYNALCLGRNPQARAALWQQLTINGHVTQGQRLKDMPPEWFFLPPDVDCNDPLLAAIAVFQCNRLHDQHDFAAARQKGLALLEHTPKLVSVYRNELNCEEWFYELMDQCRPEVLDRLRTKELLQYVKATGAYVSRCRLNYADALLRQGDQAKAKKCLASFEKAAVSYPYTGEVESEREILLLINRHFEQRRSTPCTHPPIPGSGTSVPTPQG